MNTVKLILTFIIIIGVIVGGLYRISMNSNKEKSDKLKHIYKNYEYAKGIILEKRSYKGHSVEVKYRVGNKEYNYVGGWDNDPNNLGKGDSLRLRYDIDNPKLILTELDKEY